MIRTITVQFDIDTEDYDEDEFSNHTREEFIEVAKAMLNGDADYPENGLTITCDGLSVPFNP